MNVPPLPATPWPRQHKALVSFGMAAGASKSFVLKAGQRSVTRLKPWLPVLSSACLKLF
jgi:hypothetical protein